MTVKQKRTLRERIASGEVHVTVGTHALLEDNVIFKNLGLAVIDEQHRFGVEQRSKLWTKNSIPPHVLVMTATPIPRTLAMTLYGDLDVSVIDELPPGRKPVQTIHATEGKRPALYKFMKDQIEDAEKSRDELRGLIRNLMGQMRTIFLDRFTQIAGNFTVVFKELFGGGEAKLFLTDPNNVLESGIEITVQPPGKIINNLASLSGGEQTFVAIAIYFAILKVRPAPFCILDEIEAALDEANVDRYADYLLRLTENTQFIAITHRRGTMEHADRLYGVTMQEEGVSKLLELTLSEVESIEK